MRLPKLMLLLTLAATSQADYTVTPDGTFVEGDEYIMTPDGNYVSGDAYQMLPDGTYTSDRSEQYDQFDYESAEEE